uniref:Uncharacterized protein n=1 Tax=Romanomermis culicivorax TaxID=13658 RepID=A0A915K3N2_ROMCU
MNNAEEKKPFMEMMKLTISFSIISYDVHGQDTIIYVLRMIEKNEKINIERTFSSCESNYEDKL